MTLNAQILKWGHEQAAELTAAGLEEASKMEKTIQVRKHAPSLPPMTSTERVSKAVALGELAVTMAKAGGLSKFEVNETIKGLARKRHPGLTPEQAYSAACGFEQPRISADPTCRALYDFQKGMRNDSADFARAPVRKTAPGQTASMKTIDKLVDEHMATPAGKGQSRQQAFTHIVTNTPEGKKLLARDKQERGIVAQVPDDDEGHEVMREDQSDRRTPGAYG